MFLEVTASLRFPFPPVGWRGLQKVWGALGDAREELADAKFLAFQLGAQFLVFQLQRDNGGLHAGG